MRPTLLLPLLLTALHAQEPTAPKAALPQLEQAVRDHLEAARTKHGFPGMCAAFVLPDGRTGAVAVGHVDEEQKQPLTTEHRLFSGSIGKTYVTAVALQLVAAGKLTLDGKTQDLLGENDWYPRLPNAETITLRQLLSHTSGVPEYVWNLTLHERLVAKPDESPNPTECIAYILDHKPLFAAGEGWSYADTNYLLAGLMIEAATDRTYYAVLEERVLAPQQLADTLPTNRRDLPKLANGFTSSLAVYQGPTVVDGNYFVDPSFEWCGGGLCCTTADLARWCRALLHGDVIPAELRPEMMKFAKSDRRVAKGYGLGVMELETPHGIAYGHSGIMPGYLSAMAWYPRWKLAVAVQTNTDAFPRLGKNPQRYVDEVAGIVAERAGLR